MIIARTFSGSGPGCRPGCVDASGIAGPVRPSTLHRAVSELAAHCGQLQGRAASYPSRSGLADSGREGLPGRHRRLGLEGAPGRRLVFGADVPRLPPPRRAICPSTPASACARRWPDPSTAGPRMLCCCNKRAGCASASCSPALGCVYHLPGNGVSLKVPLGKLDTERIVPLDDETVVSIDPVVATRTVGRPGLGA